KLHRSNNTTRNSRSVKTNVPNCPENEVLENGETKRAISQLIMMTVDGSVWNYRTENYQKVFFLLDTGAQKTVFQKSLAERLGLRRQVSGIGGHTEKFERHTVGVKISTAFGEELKFNFQTKPVITNSFPSVNLTPPDTISLPTSSLKPYRWNNNSIWTAHIEDRFRPYSIWKERSQTQHGEYVDVTCASG
ncbi:hypothetical protein OSTOST_03318, partial [Ostertagia ostertagi]